MVEIPRNDDGTFAEDWDDIDDFDDHPWETAVFADYDVYGTSVELTLEPSDARDVPDPANDNVEVEWAIDLDDVSCDRGELMEVSYVYLQISQVTDYNGSAEDSDQLDSAMTTVALSINGDAGLEAVDGEEASEAATIETVRGGTETDEVRSMSTADMGLLAGPLTSVYEKSTAPSATDGAGGGAMSQSADVDVDLHDRYGEGPYVDENDDVVVHGTTSFPRWDIVSSGSDGLVVTANAQIAGITYELGDYVGDFSRPW